MSIAVGVDGCKKGWFYFRRDKCSISHGIANNLQHLVDLLPLDSRIFIDIPIGLIDKGNSGRACDKEARKLLGPVRAPSVFSAPCRPVLEASDYLDAKKRSLNAIGKMLSKQAHAIVPKIKDVDDFLRCNRNKQIVIREIHPELCFWALNHQQSIKHRKKDKAGFEERLKLIDQFIPNTRSLVEGTLNSYLRKEVSRDDILDALVALIVASTSDDALKTVPETPSKDSYGLPMEIVFAKQPNERAL